MRKKQKIRNKKSTNSLVQTTLMPAAFSAFGKEATKSSCLLNQFDNPKSRRKKMPCTIIKYDEFGEEISRETF